MLSANGLKTSHISLNPRPSPLPSDLIGWLETFCRKTWLHSFPKAEQDEILQQVQDLCRPGCYWNDKYVGHGRKADEDAAVASGEREWGKTEGWSLMYVRLRGLAIKEG